MAGINLTLDEQEAKAAIAEWAKARHGVDVKASDVTFTIREADPDPRSPRPAGIGQVTIAARALPRPARRADPDDLLRG